MSRYQTVLVTVGALMLVGMGAVLAAPAPDDATCSVQAVVDGIMEWDGNFAAIDLGTMTAQADTLTGNATCTLYTNDDVTITADNTVAAELSEVGNDTLYTEYQLEYDGDGVSATGGSTVVYDVYSSFMSGGSTCTHYDEDGAVVVTLRARATNAAGTLADAGTYTATQTLTATWAGA
jgi:hypothetical protein